MKTGLVAFCSQGLWLLLAIPCTAEAGADGPRVFGLSPGTLPKTRALLATEQGKSLQPALTRLIADADKAMKIRPPSVMEKPKIPPSGDKHDYFSTAPYFWPDPTKSNGLPYLRRDGERNPESNNENSDSPRMDRMAENAETLALAYYFTGREPYAQQAARLLRVWFLEPETRMNPNFNHAQAVPGVNTGRGTGMIESRSLTSAADAAGLLAGSKAWTQADQDGMVAWMSAFLEWAQSSRHGKEEQAAKNNHGTFYDVQIAHWALFVGRTNLARQTVESAKLNRIAAQIEPDGRQPHELNRADSFGYSRFNLQAFFALATLGEHVGVDLWHFQTADGAGIRKALDFLMPYIEQPEKPWPYEHTRKRRRTLNSSLLRKADAVYGDERYLRALGKSSELERQRESLFFPQP
jgi:Alginate lyase